MAKKEKQKLNPVSKWFKTMRKFLPVVYGPFYPYKRHGHTEPYTDRPYIFIGNHLSVFDVIFPAISTDRPVHFIAKSSLFEKGLMKKFVTKCEAIPVYKDGTDFNAVMQAMRYLKKGECVGIYPEGRRNRSNETFLPFKGGATALSIKTKTPIVPIVQVKKIRLFRRAHALVGEPIEFSEYYDKRITEEDIKKCDDILLEKFYEMHAQLAEMLSKKKKGKGAKS